MGMFLAILVVLLAMVVTLALAGLVVGYVAFIDQGRDIPRAQRLSATMRRVAARWHVPTEPAEQRDPERRLHVSRGGIRGPEGR